MSLLYLKNTPRIGIWAKESMQSNPTNMFMKVKFFSFVIAHRIGKFTATNTMAVTPAKVNTLVVVVSSLTWFRSSLFWRPSREWFVVRAILLWRAHHDWENTASFSLFVRRRILYRRTKDTHLVLFHIYVIFNHITSRMGAIIIILCRKIPISSEPNLH